MKKYFEILHRCPLFEGIRDNDLSAMLGCLQAKIVKFDKRETVMAEGDPPKNIGILLSGTAQIVQMDYFGNRSIVSGVAPGELFAESFACADVTAIPVSIVATEESEVMLVDCLHIMQTCGHACSFHQQMIYNLMRTLATKNLNFHQKLEVTSKRTTREKLMAYLMLQARLHKSSRFEIPFDRQELADFLEVDRSGLSNEIAKLRREGVLESEKKQFTLF